MSNIGISLQIFKRLKWFLCGKMAVTRKNWETIHEMLERVHKDEYYFENLETVLEDEIKRFKKEGYISRIEPERLLHEDGSIYGVETTGFIFSGYKGRYYLEFEFRRFPDIDTLLDSLERKDGSDETLIEYTYLHFQLRNNVEHRNCTRILEMSFDYNYQTKTLSNLTIIFQFGSPPDSHQSTHEYTNIFDPKIIYNYIRNTPHGELFKTLPDEVRSLLNFTQQNTPLVSLESLLEKLFPDVPASVMEQLLGEIVGETDATISSLEKEVRLGSFGYSLSEAVGRFTFARSGQGYVIKVMKDRAVAEKEILVANEARKTLPLALYVPSVFVEHPISYNGYHLIVMDDLSQSPLPEDHHKQEALHSIGSIRKGLSDRLVHRLYVANLFHRSLAHLASHPLLSDLGVPQYIDGSQLQERLDSYSNAVGQKFVGKAYDASVAFLVDSVHDSSLIVHNDMREPNWVRHYLLDFGCSSRADKGGGVYRDIVRILLAEKDRRIFDPAYIHQVVNCYYAFHDFEKDQRMPSKTSRDMQQEYLLTFAQLSTEAPRHMGISCKYSSPECRQQELDWYQAVTVFAQLEFLKRTAHLY